MRRTIAGHQWTRPRQLGESRTRSQEGSEGAKTGFRRSQQPSVDFYHTFMGEILTLLVPQELLQGCLVCVDKRRVRLRSTGTD